MKKRLLIIILFFNFLAAFPQHESDYWYFGFNAGMHFVSGTPVALTDGAMYTWEGCSALTNGNGDLMFYTDGRKVWNNTHQVMPNGNGLLGDSSSTQSGMVVELPGVNKQYYLFTVDELGGADGLRYSIIDMNLDGGKGDIFQKNVALHNPVSEKISATFHSNNSNVWVLTHDWGSNAFYTYLVSPTGVDSTPVISNIGLPQSGGTLNSIGYMKFSPDGTKIALCVFGTGDIEIFDFDASTGIVSNPIIFPTQYSWAYSIEFSPDNSRLYVSQALIPRMLYQFNLNAGSPTDIVNSEVVLAQSNSIIYRGLQLGPDNKIYVSRQDQGYLGVINNPNNLGTSCNYEDQGFYLGGKIAQYGLPNFMPSYFASKTSTSEISANDENIDIYPNPASDFINIDIKNINSTKLIIDIFDIVGQKINSFIIPDNKSSLIHKTIPTKEFANSSGCYFVKISGKDFFSVKKVVIK